MKLFEVPASVKVRARYFFSNPAYATWGQTIFAALAVFVAVYTLGNTDRNQSISNALNLAQRYYTDQPSAATANLDLRVAQYEVVQVAKKRIPDYHKDKDPNWSQLFNIARPMVAERIASDGALIKNYNQLTQFYSSIILCVSNDICDRKTIKTMFSEEILGFYNAVCPYMEKLGMEYNYDEHSDLFLHFLIDVAGHKEDGKYFCREKFSVILRAKTSK